MNILVACEESQAVCKAFRDRGHNAYSCDVIECSGGHPEWHIHGDVLPLLNPSYQTGFVPTRNGIKFSSWYGIKFTTCDGVIHEFRGRWDMIIAFPPCTHLANSGAKHFEAKRANGSQRKAIEFFCQFLTADCDRVVIENPVGIISGGDYIQTWFPDLADKYNLPRPYTQKVHPWMFGDGVSKQTCLWEKGVPKLEPLVDTPPDIEYVTMVDKRTGKEKRQSMWYYQTSLQKHSDRANIRSKTFPGIANAMAEAWGT